MWTRVFISLSFISVVDICYGKSNATTKDIYHLSRKILNLNIARSNEIFETFLEQLLDVLTAQEFLGKKLKKYFKILYKELRYSDYRISRKFGKHCKYLYHEYNDDLLKELEFYRRELSKKTKPRVEFFSAINEAFTLQQKVLFNDYLYDLRDYGTDDKLNIRYETNKLINYVIIESILKLSAKSQNDIVWKLRKALKEFS